MPTSGAPPVRSMVRASSRWSCGYTSSLVVTHSSVLRAALLVLAVGAAPAADYTFYTCMVTSKDYVVGAKLPPSGIFLKSPAGEWRHAGYNHPFIRAVDYDPRDPGTVYAAAGNGLVRV